MKKIFITILLIGLTGCSFPLGSTIPDNLKLKAPKDKILYSRTITGERCLKWDDPKVTCLLSTTTPMVEYRYVTEKKVEKATFSGKIKLPKDDKSKMVGAIGDEITVTDLPEVDRNYNRVEYAYSDTVRVAEVFNGVQFVKDLSTGEWFYFDIATTTPEYFEEQTATSTGYFPDTLKIREVLAQTSSTTYTQDGAYEDGYSYRNGSNLTWADVRNGAGTTAAYADTENNMAGLQCGSISGRFNYNIRSAYIFDTSFIDDAATISAATMSVYGYAKASTLAGTVKLDKITTAANNSISTADYATTTHDFVAQSDTAINFADFSTSGYNDWALNATGIGNISKTGVTKLGFVSSYDMANSAPTHSASGWSYAQGYFCEYTGTARDPKLTVTYSTGGSTPTPKANIINFE